MLSTLTLNALGCKAEGLGVWGSVRPHGKLKRLHLVAFFSAEGSGIWMDVMVLNFNREGSRDLWSLSMASGFAGSSLTFLGRIRGAGRLGGQARG